MGYDFSAKIATPHQLCRYKVFEKYFSEWGLLAYPNCRNLHKKKIHQTIQTQFSKAFVMRPE